LKAYLDNETRYAGNDGFYAIGETPFAVLGRSSPALGRLTLQAASPQALKRRETDSWARVADLGSPIPQPFDLAQACAVVHEMKNAA
jgi:hypothetical protein